ncbi:olfactory receptor 51E2-like [Pelodiscus sinensis]|uniref:olfactory receptor 51E2-like n=1 Tax=Pelodiscus sinensis TaxID=13735 RepID=UPI003F6B3EB3
MSYSNITHFINPSTFILMGIPGLEEAYVWISIPFCTIYSLTLLGNFAIVSIVKMDRSLHGPMYYFLCMLALTDIMLSTSILPKMLAIFWFNSREISFSACLAQMFFFKCSSLVESGIFMGMAFDRYVAIFHPLRHSTILTNQVVAKIGLAVVLRGGILTIPLPLMAGRWPYCKTNIILQPYCRNASLVNLACADTLASNYYGLFVLFCVMGLDVIFIAVSYIQILRAIFNLPTKEARHKTFGTCTSHLCAMSAFYIPDVFSSLMSRFGQIVPLHVHILVSNTCLLLPLMLNPVIYGATIKQIWGRVLQFFTHKGA